jgi:tripartite-type tricarboxylate transporter receptor subunit TctC
MTHTARHLSLLAAGAAAAVGLAGCSGASAGGDTYPDDNIEIVVPFSAGGPTDTVTRLLAEPMGEDLGVQVIVENVGGAGGTIGAGEVARADTDGYTLLVHHIGMSTAPALYPDLAYDPIADFEPIGLITEVPMTIVSRASLDVDTLEELVDYLIENEDTVTLAHAGVGSASNLCGMLLQRELGIEIQEVAYDGSGPAITDVVGGQVDVLCDQTTNTTNLIESGDVKAFAVTTPERVATLPDLPTTAEAGFPDIEVSVWHGLYAPAGTPQAVIERLTAALQAGLADDNVATKYAELGTSPVESDQATPEALADRLSSQIEVWAEVIGTP